MDRTAAQATIVTAVVDQVTRQLGAVDAHILPIRADLGEHFVDGEAPAIRGAVESVVRTILDRGFKGTTTGVAKGDHGNTLACLSGSMIFRAEIPEPLRRGVAVPGAEYTVEARFSNAEEPGHADRASLSQGVALKLKDISKAVGDRPRLPDFPQLDEQHFLMTSAPVFFLRDIVEYSVAFGLRAEPDAGKKIGTLLSHLGILAPRLGEEIAARLRAFTAAVPGSPDNLLTHPYWSKHPYAWGESDNPSVAVKYSLSPGTGAKRLTVRSRHENYQKEFISEAFARNGEISFDFRVQVRPAGATEQTFPIENGHVEWNETTAPFVTIATVTFKADTNPDWLAEGAQDACSRSQFTPWNGLLAHQPLSSLARGRRYVYRASALVRDMKDELDPRIVAARG